MKSKNPSLATFTVESNYSYDPWMGAQEYRDFPVRVSVPLAQGVCPAGSEVELRDHKGSLVPCFAHPFVQWPDGSARVWEVWFPLSMKREETRRFELHAAGSSKSRPRNADGESLFPGSFILSAKLASGKTLRQKVEFKQAPRGDALFMEDEQPFTLAKSTKIAAFQGAIVRRCFRLHPGIELEIRVTNYGPDDTMDLGGLRLEFELPLKDKLRYCIRQTTILAKDHPRLVESDRPFFVRADDKGVHVTDAKQLHEIEENYPLFERGAYLCAVDKWIGVSDGSAGWGLVVPEAFERHPKAWRIEGRKVTVDLHPEDAKPLSWRQGMTLFQRVCLFRLPANATAAEFENEAQAWLRKPIVALDSDSYRAAGWRIPFRYDPKRFPKTEFQFRDSFNFTWSRGTFDWGDATIEWGNAAMGIKKSGRNLEYDFVAVAAKEHARTGSPHLLKLLRSSAEHMMYTDFIAYSTDPWKHGGIAAHGPDHTWGSCYPSHMWGEGLVLYYQLTGDRYALHVAKRVGDFFLKYIDGRFEAVQGTAREMGWLLIALSAIYDLTREPRYLAGIQRVVDYNLEQGAENYFPTGATFAAGVGIIGLDRARQFHRDKNVQKFILELLDIMMERRRDEIGLFRYWHDSEQGVIPYIQTHLPEALNIGYKLSGDERYLRAAFRLYQVFQHGGTMTVQVRHGPPECGFAAGHHISWMGCLQSFAEKGWLDKLQYPEPA